jgi:phosphoserine phosphatase
VSGLELYVPRPGALAIQELPTAPPEAQESRIWRLLLDLEISGRPGRILKGAVDAILDLSPDVNEAELRWQAQEISKTGGTPIVVAVDRLVVGLINLRDNLKPHIREKLDAVRATGIKTVMVTGDAQLTARVIAEEAGIDEVMAEAKPADKLVRVELEQKLGHVVGVEGDGTNDAPALAKADVGIAMNSGTSAAREAANMVDLDSDPAKILKVVEVVHDLPRDDPGEPGGEPPQRDAPPQPGDRDPGDDGLQRGDHPRPDPALPEGRQVPRGADGEDLRPEHGHLWPRRRRPSVPGDQGDRSAPGRVHRVT